MTGTYTVGELSEFLDQLRDHPRTAGRRYRKGLSDVRSGARTVLRELNLAADTAWDLDTVDGWCDAYPNTDHGRGRALATVSAYQARLRTAARLFHEARNPHGVPMSVAQPIWLADIEPSRATVRDVRMLAAAWHTSPGDVIAKLVEFHLTFNPVQATPPELGDDINVYGQYQQTQVTGVYHRRGRTLTVTSHPLAGQRFANPSAAATAVVKAINPAVGAANRTGWDFWIITKLGRKLRAIRPR